MSRRCGALVSALQGLGKNAQVDPKPQGPPSECPRAENTTIPWVDTFEHKGHDLRQHHKEHSN